MINSFLKGNIRILLIGLEVILIGLEEQIKPVCLGSALSRPVCSEDISHGVSEVRPSRQRLMCKGLRQGVSLISQNKAEKANVSRGIPRW